MDALSISVTCLVIFVIVFFLLIPKLRYKLSVRDGIRCYFNSRYQLFVFAHSRFGKVREGKQVYERYRDFVKALYNKDNFDKVKSEHQNNQTRINLSFLADVVDDEQFIRRYFSGDSLPYDIFLKMEEEWETRPMTGDVSDNTDVSTDNQTENTADAKPKIKRGKTDHLFTDLLLDEAPDNVEEYTAKYVRVKQKAADLVNLYYALQEAQYVNCDWNTFYNAVKNSYPEYISREERTYRGAKTTRDRTTYSHDVWENHQIELRIIKQIKDNLNP